MLFKIIIKYTIILLTLTTCVKLEEDEWWQSRIFYEIVTRSFLDSDGDGIGDLKGITSRLKYLKELGIGAAWLTPIFKSPMKDFGYDVSDYYSIHEDYGTMNDFDVLLKEATELDIKIILDFVPNHTSNEHEWFKKALDGNKEFQDYYVWTEGKLNASTGLPNNWISVFGGSAWKYEDAVGKYYLHQMFPEQPDLNYRNPIVIGEMNNVLRYWLKKGVAGFRMGAVSHLFEVDKNDHGGTYPDEPLSENDANPNDHSYLNHIYTKNRLENYELIYQWREILDEFSEIDNTTRIMMTEAYASIENVMLYYGKGVRKGSHIPLNFAFISNINGDSSARDIKFTIDQWIFNKPEHTINNWLVGNHDYSRFPKRYSSEQVDAYNMVVLLLPGISVTYMGEEIGMVDGYVSWSDTKDPAALNTKDPINYWKASRDPNRTPFQWSGEKNAGFSTANKTWLPVAAGYETLNVEAQKVEPRSHYHVYRALASLRQLPAFQHGRYESLALNEDVFTFKRWYNEECYIVVVNLGGTDHVIDLTIFDRAIRTAEVVIRNIASPKQLGEMVLSNNLSVTINEALVLRPGSKC